MGLLQDARTLVLAVSVIALVVALFGILNTTMMSVLECTPQIGVMKAVGASTGHVFGLVLVEVMILSALAALVGSLLAFFGSGLVSALARSFLPFAPTGDLVIIEVRGLLWAGLTALGLGLLAGLLPAWRAARLDPILAIRQGE